MSRSVVCVTALPGRPGSELTPATASKEQALVVLLVQQLAETQFVRGDRRAADRLWQEVAALQLESERIIHLLYCGINPEDREALREEDRRWLSRQRSHPSQRWSMAAWRPRWQRRQVRPVICSS